MGSGCGDTQDTDVKAARNIPFRGEVHPVRVRERVITVRGAAEPDNLSARGKDPRTDGGGMNTGILWQLSLPDATSTTRADGSVKSDLNVQFSASTGA
jgi:hypothetical protein